MFRAVGFVLLQFLGGRCGLKPQPHTIYSNNMQTKLKAMTRAEIPTTKTGITKSLSPQKLGFRHRGRESRS